MIREMGRRKKQRVMMINLGQGIKLQRQNIVDRRRSKSIFRFYYCLDVRITIVPCGNTNKFHCKRYLIKSFMVFVTVYAIQRFFLSSIILLSSFLNLNYFIAQILKYVREAFSMPRSEQSKITSVHLCISNDTGHPTTGHICCKLQQLNSSLLLVHRASDLKGCLELHHLSIAPMD